MDVINVTRSSMPPYEEYCTEIHGLWDSRWLTNMGAKHQALQEKLTDYLGVPHIELLVNGHMALELSLQALDLHGEVITTPFTFASTTQAIVRNGLTPVFCDIDPVTFTIDPGKIEALVTERTCAIVPVHVYGNVCDVDSISRIAERYGLKILYDAAHAFGVQYQGKGIGNFGDAACFSFHATKVFHTIEGGGVSYANKTFGKRLSQLKNFGISGPETVDEIGANGKMNEFCAAMGLCNLRHFESEKAKRKRVVERYREHLEGVPGIQLSPIQQNVQSNYAYFPAFFNEAVFGADRDTVYATLATQGIKARKYFFPLTSAFACYGGWPDPKKTPIAHRASRQVLALPLYADMETDTVDRICAVILSCQR